MKPNTIEYSKADNLIYYSPRLGTKIPIAFVPVAGTVNLLINSSRPWYTKQLCGRAISTKVPQDIKDVPLIHSDAVRLTDLTTKRVCYFAKVNGMYLRITKVENVGRNANPSNVLETKNYELSRMPKDLVNALESIIDNPEMRTIPKFGTYIPSNLAKHIRDVSTPHPKYGVPYTFKFIRVPYARTCDYRLVKEIDNNVVWSETVANCDINGVHVTPRFREVVTMITDLVAKDESTIILSNEIGEILFRAYEASAIEEPTKYRMALMTKTEGAVFIGKFLVVQKMNGNKVIDTVPVARLNKGEVKPLDGFNECEGVIKQYIPGPYDHDVRPMNEAVGETFFKLKEHNSVKPSTPKADISSKVADKRPEVKPLIFNSNTILI